MEKEKTKTTNTEDDRNDLPRHITDFLETYFQLTSIKIAERIISFTSSIVNLTLFAALFFLFVFFIGFGAAWWLGNVMNSRAAGFFIVAGIYLLCMFLLTAMGKKTTIPFLRNFITRLIYE